MGIRVHIIFQSGRFTWWDSSLEFIFIGAKWHFLCLALVFEMHTHNKQSTTSNSLETNSSNLRQIFIFIVESNFRGVHTRRLLFTPAFLLSDKQFNTLWPAFADGKNTFFFDSYYCVCVRAQRITYSAFESFFVCPDHEFCRCFLLINSLLCHHHHLRRRRRCWSHHRLLCFLSSSVDSFIARL